VPLVGGAALVAGWLAAWAVLELAGRDRFEFVPGRELRVLVARFVGPDATLWPLGGLLTAFVVGTIDDVLPDGLRPLQKLAGQALAGAVLGLPSVVADPASGEAWGAFALLAAGSVVALNLVNTFDNADGAAASLGVTGLLFPAPMFAAALAAFLPWNFGRRGAPPRAMLGDAGSHALGFAILLVPAAWPVLVLPALDLARLAWLRPRLGAAPWEGDRRHLAHRFQRRVGSALRVTAALVLIALPCAFLGWMGAPVTAALFARALRAAPAPEEAALLARRSSSAA
jgi:UDP-N-acetylmuramyl pentapeptide phosphotransferase/UDP-N-acetylglucosamine-1-phosphate transferase